MILRIPPSEFVDKFLEPASRLVERCTINLDPIGMWLIASESGVYVTCNWSMPGVWTEPTRLNLPNLKKLSHILSSIPGQTIDLEVASNNIHYASQGVSFRYHLLEDSAMPKMTASRDKIETAVRECSMWFDVSRGAISNVIKGSMFSQASNKIYIYAGQDGAVMADLTDMTMANTDSLSLRLADSYTGEKMAEPAILKFDVFRMVAAKADGVRMGFNPKYKFLVFESTSGPIVSRYIASALVK